MDKCRSDFSGHDTRQFYLCHKICLVPFLICLQPSFGSGPVVSGKLSRVIYLQKNMLFTSPFSEMAELVWSPGNISVGKLISRVRCGKSV